MLELHVYDFDGTLFRSPDPPPWWDGSWFISDASLGEPCVPEVPGSDWWIQATVAQARKSIANPDVLAIVLTGRSISQGGYRYRVPELLKQAGLHFDQVLLNTGGETPVFKAKTLVRLVREFDFDVVHVWEDNAGNMGVLKNMAQKIGVSFVPHMVHATPHPIDCTAEGIVQMVKDRWMDPKVLTKIKKSQDLSTKRVAARFLSARVPTFDARWVDALEHDWNHSIARLAKDVMADDATQRERDAFTERLEGWVAELQRDLAYRKGISLVFQAHDDIREVWSAMRSTFGRVKTIIHYAKGDRLDIFRDDVRGMLNEAPVLFKTLRKMADSSEDIPVAVVPDSVSVGRIRIIAQGDMDRAFNPEDYIHDIKKVVSLLSGKGFGKLCYGLVFCGIDRNAHAKADYNMLKDTISCYLPPHSSEIVRSLIHEFGHRWYFKFMDRSRQAQFDRFFKKVLPTTGYGGSADFEDFAEVFADWVMGASGLHREQVERLMAVLDPGNPFEQATAIVPMVTERGMGRNR